MVDTTKNTNEAAVVADLDLPPLPKSMHSIDIYQVDGTVRTIDGYTAQDVREAMVAAALARSAAPAPSLPDVAMPEPIYQVRFEHQLAWNDASEDAYHTFTEKRRRIVYLAAQPAEGSAQVARGVADLLMKLRDEGVLSEGQITKALGVDRLTCREILDGSYSAPERSDTPAPEKLLLKIETILHGIDDDQISNQDGWWENSDGAHFGAERLAEIRALFSGDKQGAQGGNHE